MNGTLASIPLLILSVTATVGCAAEAGSSDSSEDTILGGERSLEFPAIGKLSAPAGVCAATLVGPNKILTAKRCLHQAGRPSHYPPEGVLPEPLQGSFAIATHAGFKSFALSSYKTYGDFAFALVTLSESVPPSLATPLELDAKEPAPGESVSIYGFGCSERGGVIDGVKRSSTSTWKGRGWFFFDRPTLEDHRVCQGDLGAPILNERQHVVAIMTDDYLDAWWGDILTPIGEHITDLQRDLRE